MTAVCQSGWEWASNSFGQNPCAVAGALEAPCRSLVSYTLGPLNNTNYVPPPKGSALPCECNTVMYSLFMACTACQGEKTQSWTSWDQNCGAVFVTQYPSEIPVDTAIPAWAFLNVTTENAWNQNAAMAIGDSPESTGTAPPVSTAGPSSTRTGSGSLPTSKNSNSGGGGSHAGAIAGGVVGGLAALGIIAALTIWYIVRNKRSKVAPSSAFTKDYPPQSAYPTFDQPKYEQPQFEQPRYDLPPPSPAPYTSPQMQYNPSDPSTFPMAIPEPSFGATSGYPQTTYDPHAQWRGQYNGAPEV